MPVTPTTAQIREQVTSILADMIPGAPVSFVDPDSPLSDELELEAADLANLLVGLRHRLGVHIPDAAIGETTSLNTIVRFLQRKLQA